MAGMNVFIHHIYEFKKGLRNLILHTTVKTEQTLIEKRLIEENINYLITSLCDKKINVFFGHKVCVDVIRAIGDKSLNEYSEEEDFILGTMLGYDRLLQCERYIKRKKNQIKDKIIS